MENHSSIHCHGWSRLKRLGAPIGLAILTLFIFLWILGGATPAHADPGVLYVDWDSGWDLGNCISPFAACRTIGYALSQAGSGDEILVAQGVYTENLTISNGIALMGGYESESWSRDVNNYATTLDGNQNGSVVTFLGSSSGMALDGFTVTGGHAPGGGMGGGITVSDSSPTIRNTTVISNGSSADGGGIYISGGAPVIEASVVGDNNAGGCCGGIHVGNSAAVTITDTLMISNTAGYGGGLGVFSSSTVTITSSTILGNNSDFEGGQGGGIHVGNGDPTVNIFDSVITENKTRDHGAAISSDSGAVNLTNVLITNNQSSTANANVFAISATNFTVMNSTISDNNPVGAQAVILFSGALTMTNSIMWNNALNFQADPVCDPCFSVNFSDIQGGWSGTGNIDQDPLFVGVGDYSLQAKSPCINKGTIASAPPTDILGNPRDDNPDMGAYEWNGSWIYLPITVRSD